MASNIHGDEDMASSRLKNALLHGIFEWLVSLGRALPPVLARALGQGVGMLCHAFLGSERSRAVRQLRERYEHVLGQPSDPFEVRERRCRHVARMVFLNLGGWAGELCSLAERPRELSRRVHLPARARRVLDRAMAPGRGVLFLTGHLGNWEIVAWALAAMGLPTTVVGRRSYHDGITDLVTSLRMQAGVDVIHREDRDLPRRLLGALREGRLVGLLVDPSTSLPSRPVTFLGRDAPTMEAPARLAMRHRGAVVFGWCHESHDGRLVIEVEPVHIDPGCSLEVAMRVVNEHVERAVTARPDHWIWMHQRWEARSIT
jgi:KDO2-lipid IV(A) lauroyltransferase